MIQLENISKQYKTRHGIVNALENISLTVQPGEIFGIIGKSGAGKSTLIRCVNMLERPTHGRVMVNGYDMMSLKDKVLRKARHQIGMIFQHFNLLNVRTVYQNIAFPLELLGYRKAEISKRVFPLLELTGLSEKAHVYPSQLSGGQKQRVAIARALATKPSVLLCDEMTSALDPETSDSILQLIQQIHDEMQLAILLITHEMDVIKKIAGPVAVMDRGQIVEKTDVVQLFKNPQSQTARSFVQSFLKLDLPSSWADHMSQSPMPRHFPIMRITFTGAATITPVIADLMKECGGVKVSILNARIEHLRQDIFGVMVIAILGNEKEKDNVEDYLKKLGLSTEVIGYVRDDRVVI